MSQSLLPPPNRDSIKAQLNVLNRLIESAATHAIVIANMECNRPSDDRALNFIVALVILSKELSAAADSIAQVAEDEEITP